MSYRIVEEKRNPSTASPLSRALLNLVGLNKVKITETTLNKNTATIMVKLGRDSQEIKRIEGDSGIYFGYKETSKKDARVDFELSARKNFTFTTDSFHDTVNTIFGTRNKNGASYPDKTLEEVGLPGPTSLEVDLSYKTPLSVWRGLPFEITKKVSRFDLNGPHLGISWPRKEGFKIEKESLEISLSYGMAHEDREAIIPYFIDLLKRTEFIHFEENPPKGFNVKEKCLITEGELDYDKIQILEEIVRQRSPKLQKFFKTGNRADIDVEGNLDRDSFYAVPKIFDGFKEPKRYGEQREMELKGKVIGGDITVSSSDGKTKINYGNATLEEIGKFMTLPIEFSEVYMNPIRGEGGGTFYLKEKPRS